MSFHHGQILIETETDSSLPELLDFLTQEKWPELPLFLKKEILQGKAETDTISYYMGSGK